MQDQRSLLAQFLRFSSATVASLMVFSLYSIVDGLFVAKGVGEYGGNGGFSFFYLKTLGGPFPYEELAQRAEEDFETARRAAASLTGR